MAKRIKHICTLLQGANSNPVASGNFLRNISPAKRNRNVSAIIISMSLKKGALDGAPDIRTFCVFIIILPAI